MLQCNARDRRSRVLAEAWFTFSFYCSYIWIERRLTPDFSARFSAIVFKRDAASPQGS